MRTVLYLQFFQCVGERRAVSWYARRGALDQCIAAGEGPAARAAEAARAISKALYEGYWWRCFRGLRGWWGRVGHRFCGGTQCGSSTGARSPLECLNFSGAAAALTPTARCAFSETYGEPGLLAKSGPLPNLA